MKSLTIPLSALTAGVIFLAVWGAGVFPSSVCITVIALCAAAAAGLRGGVRRVPPAALAAAAILLLLLASAVPLPGRLDAMTGRLRSEQNDLVRATLAEAHAAGVIEAVTPHFSHTRNRSGTLRIMLLALLMFCSALITAGADPRARSMYLNFLVILPAAMALLGFVHQWILPAKNTIWWIFHFPHGSPVGCFVNRTHHAGFIAMLCPPALAMFAHEMERRRFPAAVLYAIAFLVMVTAVFSSLARGALIAVAAGTGAVLLIATVRRQWPAVLCISGLICVLTVGTTVTLLTARDNTIVRNVAARIGTLRHPTLTFSGRARLSVWRDSLKIWRDYPLTGSGANGFRMVFPAYRTRTDRQVFVTPENEYVELLADSGLTGVLCLAVLAGLLAVQWRHGVKHHLLPGRISMAVAGAAVVAAVHNALDVPMHTPLYGMTFASVIGMIFPTHDAAEPRFRPTGVPMPAVLRAGALLVPGAVVAFFLAVRGVEPYTLDLQDTVINADARKLARSLVYAPTSWAAWYHFGQTAFTADNRAASILAEKCMVRATGYDPLNYRLWEALGHARVSMGMDGPAREAFERTHALRPWKKPPQIQRGW